MIAFPWTRVLRWFMRRRRPKVVRWVCACGYRKRETGARRETRDCPYCYREITPEVLR